MGLHDDTAQVLVFEKSAAANSFKRAGAAEAKEEMMIC